VTNKKIKKIDLVNILSKKTGFSQNYSKKLIDDLLLIINLNISKGQLNLKNFGSFKILNKKQRIGRNPKTKKEYIISKRKSVSFIPSKKISDYLNKLYE
tara:strand:+ start:3587 stop:3883 length:297 start_codon:yes stop_codon:yes gene_type:complete